ncbi:unnamed protein product [Boreogadus saida]
MNCGRSQEMPGVGEEEEVCGVGVYPDHSRHSKTICGEQLRRESGKWWGRGRWWWWWGESSQVLAEAHLESGLF